MEISNQITSGVVALQEMVNPEPSYPEIMQLKEAFLVTVGAGTEAVTEYAAVEVHRESGGLPAVKVAV